MQQHQHQLRLLLALVTLVSRWPTSGATFSGTCYDWHGWEFATCSEVSNYCSASSCSSMNGALQYTCYYSSYSCSGSYSPTPAATTSTPVTTEPTPSPTLISSDCNGDLSYSISSCDDVQEIFDVLGCSCYTCTEYGASVEFQCTSPFQCSNNVYSSARQEEIMNPPEMNGESYGLISAVYIGVAVALVGSTKLIASLCFRQPPNAEPSVKERLISSLSPVKRKVFPYLVGDIAQEDGSAMGLIDYLCDINELAGLIDCRAKTKAVKPRWMRVLAILSTSVVTASLASLFGTVVFNNENCVANRSVSYCYECACETYCNGVDIGCTNDCQCIENFECSRYSCVGARTTISSDSATTITTTVCYQGDIKYSRMAELVTTGLTKVVEIASSMALGTAPTDSPRQKVLSTLNFVVAIVLLGFGVAYSSSLAKEQDPFDEHQDASSRRVTAIIQVLWTAWLANQALETRQFVTYARCRFFYACLYLPEVAKLLATKPNVSGAVVHPRLEHGLDNCILKTDLSGAKEAITPDSVVLEQPSGIRQESART